ncbi:MAG: septal ring lytic transglycosylase RlpA family protein [Betaproteobacteria bacterium]
MKSLPLLLCLGSMLLAACSSAPKKGPPSSSGPSASAPTTSSKYYKDDGPGDNPPSNLDSIPDATPRLEPLNRFANRPYTVLGKDYVPATALRAYKERGIASWYGRKFHGQKTSNGETYDMYAMSAAHPTLPLPSYARVTNMATGKSVVVRVNDRGPFLHDRIIDLSYAAANRIGVAARGSGEVVVESIIPGEGGTVVAVAPPSALSPTAQSDTNTAPLRTVDVPQAAPISSESSGGFAVQLGAFQNFNNAQAFLAHVQAQLASAQVEPKVREQSGLYRVFVGPFKDRDEARRVADRLTMAFGFATAVAPH